MIDTDKYEGHVADFGKMWSWSEWARSQFRMNRCSETETQMDATSALLNDAPLLLAEVKRLNAYIESIFDGGHCDIETYEEYKERIE